MAPVEQVSSQTNKPHKTTKSHAWVWLVLLVLAGAVVWLVQSRQTHAQGPKPRAGRGPGMVPVSAAPTRRSDIPVYLEGLGSVTPFYMVTVHSRVDGQLMNVYFREGQFVGAGDLLVQIDPRPFQVQLEQAEGQMAHDQALLSNARVDLKRYKTLLAQEAIPSQQLDTQAATVAQYEGAIKTDQAAIDNAKLQLTYCRITAPISGRIGLRLVDPGNMVHANDTNGLLTIMQVQPITVVFTLPEDSLPQVYRKLRAGAALPVDAYNRDKSKKLESGKLLTVDNQIDPATGTARLKAVFANRDSALFPNQFVNVRLLVDTLHQQVNMPAVAIQRGATGGLAGAQGTFVYVVKPDNTVEVRPIALGVVESGMAAVTEGLKEGEMVVVDGADKLQPGSKVTVRPGNGAPNRPQSTSPAAGKGGGRPA